MDKRTLKTGVAYHGNRMPSHALNDMREIARADMDIVVHMFSHNDWDRHSNRMKDIFKITEDQGLEVWVDNWGLGGPPGDKSHFLSFHPDAHMLFSNGQFAPVNVCLNHPEYRKFVKKWIDTVKDAGAKTIMWDEPNIPKKKTEDGKEIFACCCPICKKLFEEKYNRPMPEVADADVERFRTDTILDFFRDITGYSASLGLQNMVTVMLEPVHAIYIDNIDELCAIDTIHNIGTDPYWCSRSNPVDPYERVYLGAKKTVDVCNKFKKDHNVWIQGFDFMAGYEEDIIHATEAAYDAGARTILSWSFMGAQSNNYASDNPQRTWDLTVEAMRRIRSVERDRIWAEYRKKFNVEYK